MKKSIIFLLLIFSASISFAQETISSPPRITINLSGSLPQDSLTRIYDTTTAIRTDLETARTMISDSNAAYRTLLDAQVDTNAAYRTLLDTQVDTNAAYRTLLDAQVDTNAAFRTLHNAATDTVAVHRTAIDSKLPKAGGTLTGVINFDDLGVTFQLHTPAAGDSALGRLWLRDTDTCWVMGTGTDVLVIKDLAP